jgi:ubiquinone/menaquinone biosynthesis C-methylase UbiE
VSSKPDFGARAATYDELRPVDERWHEVYDALVLEGDLAGRRVLDVGCGTGRTAAGLTARFGCTVTGVDASREMLAVSRARAPAADFLEGRAERLPVADGASSGR